MAADQAQYDSALLGILKNEGKVAPFLDVILGFLYRRTDYFRVMRTDSDKLGFPPGVAFKLLKNIFSKYESLAQKAQAQAEEIKKSRSKKSEAHQQSLMDATPTVRQDPVPSTPEECKNKDPVKEDNVSSPSKVTSGDGEEENMETSVSTHPSEKPQVADINSKTKSEETEGEDSNEDPELARERRQLQANPLTYNGAERESYYWSQSITEVDVRVKVPNSVKRGKHVKVDIKSKHISVCMMEEDGSWTTLVDSDLTWEISKEDSMWTLSPGEFVHVNLEKRQERWWENVFTDEPKINTRKIDCSRPMTDLDDEAQAKIEEMMYNQRQKQLGLPQSHEVKTHEMLRKAWDAEGSPFKGQQFDPSKFSVDSSGVINMKQ